MWIAKSKDGMCTLWERKPVYLEACGVWENGFWIGTICESDAPSELTFENSPQEVKLQIVK